MSSNNNGAAEIGVDIQNIGPSEFEVDSIVSTAESLVSSQWVEIPPVDSSGTYAYGSQPLIKFNIGSQHSFLVGKKCYLKFDFQITSANHPNKCAFDAGGAHSLFRSLEWKTIATGQPCETIVPYNKIHALRSLLNDDPLAISHQGYAYGDDLDGLVDEYRPLTGTVTIASGVITGSGTKFLREVKPGDQLFFSGTYGANDDVSFNAVVNSTGPTSDTALTLTDTSLNLDATGRIFLYRSNSPGLHRRHYCDGNIHTICMPLDSRILDQNMPLFLFTSGLELTLEIDQPNHGICLLPGIADADTYSAITFNITNPRFVAMMVQPTDDIKAQFQDQWKSPQGIVYSIPGVGWKRVSASVGTTDGEVFNIPIGVSSVRRIIMGQQNTNYAEAGTTSAAANLNSYTAAYPRGGLNSLQFQVGSHRMPAYPLRTTAAGDSSTNNYFSEAFEQLRKVMGRKVWRLNPTAWKPNSGAYPIAANVGAAVSGVAFDHKTMLFGVAFDRDSSSLGQMTGTDFRLIPLTLSITRQVAWSSIFSTGNPVFYFMVDYDRYMILRSGNVAIMN